MSRAIMDRESHVHPSPVPSNTLADYLDDQAGWYEAQGDDNAAFAARHLRELAATARFLRATDGDTFDDREQAMEAHRDQQIEEEAFAAGERHAVAQLGRGSR